MESGWPNREIVENPQVVLHNNHDIPQDIIYEILTRLPVESLLRFKAVSKLWHSTISNPTFRRRCSATSIFAMSRSNTKDFYLMSQEGVIEKFQVPAWSRLEIKATLPTISNSCNGMLLLRHDTAIFLFNPSTRYIDKVLTLEKNYDYKISVTLGFCYDESIANYKVVIFLWHSITGDKSAIVATLKKKEWTALHIPREFLSTRLGPLVNDRLHLMVGHRRTGYNAIVYFNPIKDVFEKVACPRPNSKDENEVTDVGVLDDCLCMTRRIGEHRRDAEVLKMKEYGVAESWTTLFVIKNSYSYYWMDPLFQKKNGDIILIRDMYTLSRYNLAKNEYINLTGCRRNSIPHMQRAVTFAENLFFPKSSLVASKYRGDGYTRNVRVCFNCGEAGHMAGDCSSGRRCSGRCFNCGKQGHFARDCSRGDSRCYNCGKPGHFARDCRF